MPDFKKKIERLKSKSQTDNNSEEKVDLSAVEYAGNDTLEKNAVDKTITEKYEPGREYLGGKDRYVDPNSTSPAISNNNYYEPMAIAFSILIGLFILRKIFIFIKK
jgi:hypothetical protein